MSIQELTSEEIQSLVGTRHPITAMEYPPPGMRPYYEWLLRSLHLLSESSAGALRVARDDDSATTIHLSPGRATLSGTVLDVSEQSIDLASYNNDTALVWLEDNSGPQIGTTDSATGWPVGVHLKLAEVALSAGEITDILDRRFETIFSV